VLRQKLIRFTVLFILFSVLSAQESRLENLNKADVGPDAVKIRQEIEDAGRVNFERIQAERRPEQFVGVWQGRGYQVGKGDWPVQMELILSGMQGKIKGRVLYPALECEAQLQFLRWEGRTAIFTERFEKPGRCIPNGFVRVTPSDLDSLRYVWASPDGKEMAQGDMFRCAKSFEPAWGTGSLAKNKEQLTQATLPILLTSEKRKPKVAQDTRLDEERFSENEIQEKRKKLQDLYLQELQQIAKKPAQEQRELERKLPECQSEVERSEVQRCAEERRRAVTQARLEQIRAEIEERADASANTTAGRQPAQRGGITNFQETQYYAAVAARILPFFQLPEIKRFDPALVTIVIITINTRGEVADAQIESSSGDALYDQLVLKSIEAANPLPPIPPALRKQRIEMGLKFSPNGSP